MTDALLRRGEFALAPVQRRDLDEAAHLCASNPIAGVVPAAQVEAAKRSGIMPSGLWVVRRRGYGRELAGVVWCGANLTAVLPVPEEDEDDARAEVAQALATKLSRPAAMVGEAHLTMDLWGRVEPWWGPARQVRPRQLSMALRGDPQSVAMPLVTDLEPLRQATMDDYMELLPAAVHMFMGEVGYDPLKHGREMYEDRLLGLVAAGRSYVQYAHVGGKRTVAFKAEVGIVGGDVAQVQGVWVHPEVRGRGLGTAGMIELARLIRAAHAPVVSLYVNDFNEHAIRAYRSAGFTDEGIFATVMF